MTFIIFSEERLKIDIDGVPPNSSKLVNGRKWHIALIKKSPAQECRIDTRASNNALTQSVNHYLKKFRAISFSN